MKPIRIATLTVGDSAPDFSGIAVGAEFADGKPFRLSNYFDEQIVLYFYPQDHTPGCTAQACKLRDAWAEFGNRATLFGISTDSLESHLLSGKERSRSASLNRFCRMTFSSECNKCW